MLVVSSAVIRIELDWLLLCILVQEMGRVDRNPLSSVGDNRYEVHISFICVVKLFVRIMQNPQAEERATQLASMMDVLHLLVTPNECQHVLSNHLSATF